MLKGTAHRVQKNLRTGVVRRRFTAVPLRFGQMPLKAP